MIKNGPKVFLAAVCLCILLCVIFFAIRTSGNDLPKNPVEKPLTVDLNTANAKELCSIPGISPALARAIVAYRENYGDYVDTDELLDIKGMSEELYAEILEYISIGGS